MRLAFQSLVAEATRRVAAESQLDPARLDGLLATPVETCPPERTGQIASPVAFSLARFLPGREPAEVARALREQIEQLQSGEQQFSLEIGGDGFLNAAPTDAFVSHFVYQAATSAGQSLLPDSIAVGLSRDKLEQRVQRSANADAEPFCREVSATQQVRSADWLMLLALIDDPELELRPYRAGLCGRQNISWYLERAISDAQRAATHDVVLDDDSSQWFSTLRAESSLAQPAVQALLDFRGRVFHGGRSREADPICLVAGLVDLARGFYCFFNHPDCRARLASGEARALAPLISATSHLLRRGRNLAENSCEKAQFVLVK